MHIHVLQHVPFEGPAAIEDWALSGNHTLSVTRLYAQEPFPALDRFELLVVMGGPMSIHDEYLYPWLKGEKWFIRQAVDAGKAVLGVCLGGQLIAAVLGGEVHAAEQGEIGWFPIERDEDFAGHVLGQSLPQSWPVFHWHGEAFSLPPLAQRIASSQACANQGFLYNERVIALQCHLESTPQSIETLIEYCGDELLDAPNIQTADEMLALAAEYTPALRQSLYTVLDYLEKVVTSAMSANATSQ